MNRLNALLVLALSVIPASWAADRGPQQVVEEAAQAARELVQSRHDELAADPDLLYSEVEALMKPFFDIAYSAKLVLGRAGRDATPEQRSRFARALYQALIRKYADGLLDYDRGDIQYLPFRGDSSADRARIRTVVVLEDGKRVPVDYLMHRTDDGWKAYDVSVEGISYVTNYRNQFASEIADRGLDAVIARLENVDADDEITAAADS